MKALLFLALLSNLPPESDLDRFPPPYVVQVALDQNAAYRACLEAQHCYYHHCDGWFRDAYDDAGRLRDAWWALSEAQTTVFCGHYLGELRELIGREAYEGGWLPCPVPVERMRRVD